MSPQTFYGNIQGTSLYRGWNNFCVCVLNWIEMPWHLVAYLLIHIYLYSHSSSKNPGIYSGLPSQVQPMFLSIIESTVPWFSNVIKCGCTHTPTHTHTNKRDLKDSPLMCSQPVMTRDLKQTQKKIPIHSIRGRICFYEGSWVIPGKRVQDSL